MAAEATELTLEEFEERFPRVANPHPDAEPTWEDDDGNGCWFETFGDQLEFVKKQNPLTIWTVLDDDSVVSGFHVANRSGYLISKVARGADEAFVVPAQPMDD
jgi:hypothetical protein